MEDKSDWVPFKDVECTCPHCNKRVSVKVFDAERELAECQERLAEAEKILSEVISQNKIILNAIDKISHWVNPAEVNIQFVLSEINSQAEDFFPKETKL